MYAPFMRIMQELTCTMRGLLEAGAEVEGSTAHHQLTWLINHYQQVR